MTYKEIHDLIKLINKYKLSEFQLKEGEFELSIKTKGATADPIGPAYLQPPQAAINQTHQVLQVPEPPPVALPEQESPQAEVKSEVDETSQLLEIRSPIVGTFYRSSSPEKPVYVKVGDSIDAGSVVCIVEAMKLFNEIESEVSGKIVNVMVEDASPVEYDQVLFLVDPNG